MIGARRREALVREGGPTMCMRTWTASWRAATLDSSSSHWSISVTSPLVRPRRGRGRVARLQTRLSVLPGIAAQGAARGPARPRPARRESRGLPERLRDAGAAPSGPRPPRPHPVTTEAVLQLSYVHACHVRQMHYHRPPVNPRPQDYPTRRDKLAANRSYRCQRTDAQPPNSHPGERRSRGPVWRRSVLPMPECTGIGAPGGTAAHCLRRGRLPLTAAAHGHRAAPLLPASLAKERCDRDPPLPARSACSGLPAASAVAPVRWPGPHGRPPTSPPK